MKVKYVLNLMKVYGVSVLDENGCVMRTASFFGKTKNEVKDFIELCNSEQLDPIHLRDAISDILHYP